MAQVKAGKKVKAAFGSFQQQRTARVRARQSRRKVRQTERTKRTQFRQAGKIGKAEAIAAGGGFIGRQDAIGQIGTGFIDAAGTIGAAAATGGSSSLLGSLGGLGGRGDMSGMAFDTGSGQVVSAMEPEQPFYTKPVFLIAAGLGLFFILRPKK